MANGYIFITNYSFVSLFYL